MDIVTDRLNERPSALRLPEELPRHRGQQIRLAISAAQEEYQGLFRQILHRVLLSRRNNDIRQAGISYHPVALIRNRPGGATIRLHQFPKPSR